MGDVRASTQVPDSLSRDPLPARRRTSTTNSLGRSSMGRASDYTPSGAEVEGYDAYAETSDPGATADLGKGVGSSTRSSGYDSLFNSSSMTAASSSASKSPEQPAPASAVGVSTHAKTTAASSYDPYQAYEGAGAASHKPTRNVVVISPNAYGEVESVARNLKAGDAVVLSLRNTPSQLSKRILDFSFGVASALDASVDCVADKVFAITRGSALSDAECMKLRGQGVL
jgi:cell division inhibitor SepF